MILTPNNMEYEEIYNNKIETINKKLLDNIDSNNYKSLYNLTEEEQLAYNNFTKNDNFSKEASLISYHFLNNSLKQIGLKFSILLSDKKSNGKLSNLKKLAQSNNSKYIFNISTINFFRKKTIDCVRLKIEIYNNLTQSIILDKEYEGNSSYTSTKEKPSIETIELAIKHALNKATDDFIFHILSLYGKDLTSQKLTLDRFNQLNKNHFSNSINPNFAKQIIKQPDKDINLNELYQTLRNKDKTQFVAFFIDQPSKQLNKPINYAYIVKAVKFNGKWYYEKSQESYFYMNNYANWHLYYFYNLIRWNYFKKASTELNPDFWNTSLFNKIENIEEEGIADDYELIVSKSINEHNNSYEGLFEIVANHLRREKEIELAKFRDKLENQVFIPFYEKLKKLNPKEFKDYSIQRNKFTLIYPNTMKIAINPIMITDGKGNKTLRFFVYLPETNTIYEWTYLEPKALKKETGIYSFDIVQQMKKVTSWNYSFETLNNKDFWSNYVLFKENERFKYLTKLKTEISKKQK
jgi:hypothetical protein